MSKDHGKMSRHPEHGATSGPVDRVVSRRALVCSATLAVILVSYLLVGEDTRPRLLEFLRAAGERPGWAAMALGLLLTVDLVAPLRAALLSTMAGLALGLCAGMLASWLGPARGGTTGQVTARLGLPPACRLLGMQGRRQLRCLGLRVRGIAAACAAVLARSILVARTLHLPARVGTGGAARRILAEQRVHADRRPWRITAATGAKVGAGPTGGARAPGGSLGRGTRAAVSSERQRPSAGGLTAALDWGEVKVYGHQLQSAAVHCSDLTGAFAALNVEYADGRRVLWVYLEARRDLCDQATHEIATAIVRLLEERSAAFREKRRRILQENGEADFGEQFRIVVLPFGHRTFGPPAGRKRLPYIRPLMQSPELPPAAGAGGPLS